MAKDVPARVAIIGGGCASMATAFELTRPEHRGKYDITVYQVGWRLGGKGASGRGPSGRIEEHGLHVWMGFYENAFRLMRECYAELGRDAKTCPIADWRDAFFPDPFVGVTDRTESGQWIHRTASFPPAEGLPGDPIEENNPFTVQSYMMHTAALLRTLLFGVRTQEGATAPDSQKSDESHNETFNRLTKLLRYGVLSTTAGLIEAISVLEVIFRSFPRFPDNAILRLLEAIRLQLEKLVVQDEKLRYQWEIIDLVMAIMVGSIRFGLAYHPKGFDAINDYECTEWLRLNGASEKSVKSAFVRGLHDLAFAFGEDGPQPGLAAGQAIRGSLRMMFTYRGAIFWKMRGGMGDIVFGPYYEVLKKRGVKFEFFHRLTNVGLPDRAHLQEGERMYVDSLEFDVQAEIVGDEEYQPLVDVRGLPSWPSQPDYAQLEDGKRMKAEKWKYESHWDRHRVGTKTLKVVRDFDFVVLGIGIGAIPDICTEIIEQDERWQQMVKHVTTAETQAFQLWLNEDMPALGWTDPPVNISGYVHPFNTWADMRQLIPIEDWTTTPGAIAYFCNALPDDADMDRSSADYPSQRRAQVRENAIRFLDQDISRLWPRSVDSAGKFRWELLMDATKAGEESESVSGEARFDTQFWVANVNPSDRYVLAPPGSIKYRISPLDNTYDNLTIAGDWTDAGFNEGCVEAAVMSGRLAAHAISHYPPLQEIVGYDHP